MFISTRIQKILQAVARASTPPPMTGDRLLGMLDAQQTMLKQYHISTPQEDHELTALKTLAQRGASLDDILMLPHQ